LRLEEAGERLRAIGVELREREEADEQRGEAEREQGEALRGVEERSAAAAHEEARTHVRYEDNLRRAERASEDSEERERLFREEVRERDREEELARAEAAARARMDAKRRSEEWSAGQAAAERRKEESEEKKLRAEIAQFKEEKKEMEMRERERMLKAREESLARKEREASAAREGGPGSGSGLGPGASGASPLRGGQVETLSGADGAGPLPPAQMKEAFAAGLTRDDIDNLVEIFQAKPPRMKDPSLEPRGSEKDPAGLTSILRGKGEGGRREKKRVMVEGKIREVTISDSDSGAEADGESHKRSSSAPGSPGRSGAFGMGATETREFLDSFKTMATGFSDAVRRDPLREVLEGGGGGGGGPNFGAGANAAGLQTRVVLRGELENRPRSIWMGFEARLKEHKKAGEENKSVRALLWAWAEDWRYGGYYEVGLMKHAAAETYGSLRASWDAMPEEQRKLLDRPLAQLALTLMSADQSSYDQGSWDLAWPMSLFCAPPDNIGWQRRAQKGRSVEEEGLSPVCDGRWGNAFLTYLERVSNLQDRRAKLVARGSGGALQPGGAYPHHGGGGGGYQAPRHPAPADGSAAANAPAAAADGGAGRKKGLPWKEFRQFVKKKG
jgi:hypothetical protein